MFFKMIIVCLCLSYQVWSMSLHDAQQQMFANNGDIKNAENLVEQKHLTVVESQSLWYPSVDAFASYGYLTEKNTITLELNPLLPAQPKEIGTSSKTETGVDVSWPVFTGFARSSSIVASRLGLRVQQQQLQSIKNQLSLSLGVLYLQWLSFSKQCAIYKQQHELLTQLQQQQSDQQKAGTSTSTSQKRIVARLNMIQVNLGKVEFSADSCRILIAQMIDKKEEDVALDTLFQELSEPQLMQAQLDLTRPEYTALTLAKSQLEMLRGTTSAQFFPSVFVNAGVRYANPGLAMGSSEFMGYGLAGAQLKWNLFSGFKHTSQYVQYNKKIALVDQQKIDLISQFHNKIAIIKKQLGFIDQQQSAAQSAVEASQAVLADLENMKKAGIITNYDYLNGVTDLVEAQVALQQISYAKQMLLLQLAYALGVELTY